MLLEITSDPALTSQVINYIIVDSYARCHPLVPTTESIVEELAQQGVKYSPFRKPLTPGYIKQRTEQLRSEQIPMDLPAILRGNLSNRSNKKQMYAKLDRLIECFIDKPLAYCGLPAHQLLRMLGEQHEKIVAVEKDRDTHQWLSFALTKFLSRDDVFISRTSATPPDPNRYRAALLQGDIICYLAKFLKDQKSPNFNIFDLDLMISLENFGEKICLQGVKSVLGIPDWVGFSKGLLLLAHMIYYCSAPVSVINLVATYGRSITEARHDWIIENYLEDSFLNAGFKQARIFRGKYKDRFVPMKYEHVLLTK